HLYAWRNLRGPALARYVLELSAIVVALASIFFLPRYVREWSVLGPLIVVGILQNVRIVTGHMDLPSGKYHDTWQLVLPGWLSVCLLHSAHPRDPHSRPRFTGPEPPPPRAKLAAHPDLPLQPFPFVHFFFEVFLTRRYTLPSSTTNHAASEDGGMIAA